MHKCNFSMKLCIFFGTFLGKLYTIRRIQVADGLRSAPLGSKRRSTLGLKGRFSVLFFNAEALCVEKTREMFMLGAGLNLYIIAH